MPLVSTPVIWASAGRHPELGGGLHVYKLNAEGGKMLWHHVEDERKPDTD